MHFTFVCTWISCNVSCKHGHYSKFDLGLVYNPFHFLHSLYLTTLQNFILNKNLNPPIFLHTAIDNSKFISIIYFVRIFKFIQNEYDTWRFKRKVQHVQQTQIKSTKNNNFKAYTNKLVLYWNNTFLYFYTFKNQGWFELQNCIDIDCIIKPKEVFIISPIIEIEFDEEFKFEARLLEIRGRQVQV